MPATTTRTWKVWIVCDLPPEEIKQTMANWHEHKISLVPRPDAEELTATLVASGITARAAIEQAVERLDELVLRACGSGLTTYRIGSEAVEARWAA